MAEAERVITINDKDYNIEDLDAVQQNYLQHIQDLDLRTRQTQFSLQEMQAAREYFSQSLVHSVEAPAEESADE